MQQLLLDETFKCGSALVTAIELYYKRRVFYLAFGFC